MSHADGLSVRVARSRKGRRRFLQLFYTRRLKTALRSGGHFIIGTFAVDGPERCSGLPVIRYDAAGLSAEIGPEFELIATRPHEHITPRGATQRFQFFPTNVTLSNDVTIDPKRAV